jgi:hypothetical protein
MLTGDQIESHLGVTFGLGTLACAGLGNLLSDVVGQLSGGAVEKGASRYVDLLHDRLAGSL